MINAYDAMRDAGWSLLEHHMLRRKYLTYVVKNALIPDDHHVVKAKDGWADVRSYDMYLSYCGADGYCQVKTPGVWDCRTRALVIRKN